MSKRVSPSDLKCWLPFWARVSIRLVAWRKKHLPTEMFTMEDQSWLHLITYQLVSNFTTFRSSSFLFSAMSECDFADSHPDTLSTHTFMICVCLLGILRQTDKRQQEKPRMALCCRWLSASEIQSRFTSVCREQQPSSGLNTLTCCVTLIFHRASCSVSVWGRWLY